jgi:hypothetical protein
MSASPYRQERDTNSVASGTVLGSSTLSSRDVPRCVSLCPLGEALEGPFGMAVQMCVSRTKWSASSWTCKATHRGCVTQQSPLIFLCWGLPWLHFSPGFLNCKCEIEQPGLYHQTPSVLRYVTAMNFFNRR